MWGQSQKKGKVIADFWISGLSDLVAGDTLAGEK